MDRTSFPTCTRCGWSAANWRSRWPFPPRARKAFHQQVLDELLEERVVSTRGHRRPRGVKRKMSSYPLRPRAPIRSQRQEVEIVILPP